MLQSLILVAALCTDTFVASLAYGTNCVKVDFGKIVLLNGICSLCLGLALGFGTLFHAFAPEGLTRGICFASLFVLGFIKFLDYGIKAYINRRCKVACKLSFSLSSLKVIVSIYGDPMAADADHSKSLSWREVTFLGLAMSLDSLVAGTMAGLLSFSPLITLAMSFMIGIAVMEAGLWLGRRAASRWNCDLSWISGVLLMLLAVMKV